MRTLLALLLIIISGCGPMYIGSYDDIRIIIINPEIKVELKLKLKEHYDDKEKGLVKKF